MQKLPVGIQTFGEIREENYLYIDKTDLACQLVEEGKYYFLARPRRFGKSRLVSTLQALFAGRKELFSGLAAEKRWDWSVKYPVIKISFKEVAHNLAEMKSFIAATLRSNQQRLQLEDIPETETLRPSSWLRSIILKTYAKYGKKIIVLVDDYDKFILDNLGQTEIAKQAKFLLLDLYTTIKDSDEYIKFAFLTGVSKFSKASVFSGLNNLEDISLSPAYATLCGYTQNDLDTTFAKHLAGADRKKVRQWYNGYNFLGESVYNPFDILLFIKNGLDYRNYWFSTGTPTFLIKLIQQHNYYVPQLDQLQASESLIDSFDIENIKLEPILFQAGYLSIKSKTKTDFGPQYILGFPNKEVAISFNDVVVRYLTNQSNTVPVRNQLLASLKQADLEAFEHTLRSLFASIPYTNYVNNTISSYEGYYASVIYAYLASLGLDITGEDVTNKGRIDLTLQMEDAIYIIEFKVDGPGKALEQIKAKNYQQKYLNSGKPITLIGIDFDAQEKNLCEFAWQRV